MGVGPGTAGFRYRTIVAAADQDGCRLLADEQWPRTDRDRLLADIEEIAKLAHINPQAVEIDVTNAIRQIE